MNRSIFAASLVASSFVSLLAAAQEPSIQYPASDPSVSPPPSVPASAAPKGDPRRGAEPSSAAGTEIVVSPTAASPSRASAQSATAFDPGPAPGRDADADRAPAQPRPAFDRFQINAGVKIGYVPNRAFDTFASNDTLPQFAVDGIYNFLTSDRLALGAGLGWDAGGRGSELRNTIGTSMAFHRFTIPIQARLKVTNGIHAFAKAAPGTAVVTSELDDRSSPNGTISGSSWVFAADASVGGSVRLGSSAARGPHVWLTPEFGYSFTTQATVRPEPGRPSEDVLGADERTNLASLALSGFFWRASIGVTF